MSEDALRDKVRSKGFTPGRRETRPLLALLADGEAGKEAEQALLRSQDDVIGAALAGLEGATPELRRRLVTLVGKAAAKEAGPHGPAVCEALLGALRDADARTRKEAARALGRACLQDSRIEAALLGRLEGETDLPVLRAAVEALGKVGGPTSLAMLMRLKTDDAMLRQARDRARLMLERTGARPASRATIDATRGPSRPISVVLRCRAGLAPLLAEEVAAMHPVIESPSAVRVLLGGPLASLESSRLFSHVAIPLCDAPLDPSADVAETVAEALAGAAPILRPLAPEGVRFRLAWAGQGHRRALTWRVAERVAQAGTGWVNDPRGSAWEITVDPREGRLHIEAEPRGVGDARFAYRAADVPAASHPSFAAAIARLGEARPADVVWDPFVGSGLELAERARLGAFTRMIGTDLDERALDAARKNLARAGVRGVTLMRADARTFAPAGVNLVLTNPPMGRRVQSATNLDALLLPFLENLAAALRRGGRFVWITPRPKKTDAVLAKAGFRKARGFAVDMGGFEAELQSWRR